jgi:hypothetical protein
MAGISRRVLAEGARMEDGRYKPARMELAVGLFGGRTEPKAKDANTISWFKFLQ